VSAEIKSKVAIVVPPALVPMLDHLVTEFALANKEEPGACRRTVEELVIRLGAEAYRAELEAGARRGGSK
jgi:hypothetical protein